MSWEAIGAFALAAISFAGINAGALRWMLDRRQAAAARDYSRFEEIERALFELRAALPLEYVRREDWIRFSGTLDAKLDGLRDELGVLKERLYV